MNHSTSPRTEHLFIVRVWWEPDGVTATAQWRGSVQHAAGRRYFASWEEMAGYLAEMAQPCVIHCTPEVK